MRNSIGHLLLSLLPAFASSDPLFPRQVHTCKVGQETYSVTYTTDYGPAESSQPGGRTTVQWWQSASSSGNITVSTNVGSNVTFPVPIAWDETGEFINANISHNLSIHTVLMTNLSAKEDYQYRVGNDADGWSNVFTLRTLPTSKPNEDSPLQIAVVGDFGIHDTTAQTLPALQNEAFKKTIDAVLHIGDIAYDLDLKRGEVGDEFMEAIEPIASSVPYFACPGNHEFNYNFTAFTHRFNGLPTNDGDTWGKIPPELGANVAGMKNNLFYSFDIANVHFVSLSTELIVDILDVTPETRYGFQYPDMTGWQSDFLVNDLEANRANNLTDWIVVFSHHPMYCSCEDDDCKGKHAEAVRQGVPGNEGAGLENTLLKYGVDLYLSGHVHMYERMLPVYNHTTDTSWYSEDKRVMTNPGAPVHIVSGSGGGPEGTEGFDEDEILDFSVTRIANFGYSKMIVYNETHLKFEQWGTSDGGGGNHELVDWMWIVK